jgi:hypothetical protein
MPFKAFFMEGLFCGQSMRAMKKADDPLRLAKEPKAPNP